MLNGSQSLEAALRICYCPTRTFAHELLVIWPVACLAWLPSTEHQSCEHLIHEGNSATPFGLVNGSQSLGSYLRRLLLPYKDLRARTFGNLACCVPSYLGYHAQNQSCEHLSHEGNSAGPFGFVNGSQSSGSNITCLLLPYKDLATRSFGNLTCCVLAWLL